MPYITSLEERGFQLARREPNFMEDGWSLNRREPEFTDVLQQTINNEQQFRDNSIPANKIDPDLTKYKNFDGVATKDGPSQSTMVYFDSRGFTTIAEAINHAINIGYTSLSLLLRPGTYVEAATLGTNNGSGINLNLSLTGESRESCIISLTAASGRPTWAINGKVEFDKVQFIKSSETDALFELNGDNTTINNCILQNSTSATTGSKIIDFYSSGITDVSITNNLFSAAGTATDNALPYACLSVPSAGGITRFNVIGNIFNITNTGISILAGTQINISKNAFQLNSHATQERGFGVYIKDPVTLVTVEGNTIQSDGTNDAYLGIEFDGEDGNFYKVMINNNVITDCKTGIKTQGGDITMLGNSVDDCSTYGISVNGGTLATVATTSVIGCQISDCTLGIYIAGSNTLIEGCTIYNCTDGIEETTTNGGQIQVIGNYFRECQRSFNGVRNKDATPQRYQIMNNSIYGNGAANSVGIHIPHGVIDFQACNNEIIYCENAITVRGEASATGEDVVINDNMIKNCSWGILLWRGVAGEGEVVGGTLCGNRIEVDGANFAGIFLNDWNGVITGNELRTTQSAIVINGNMYGSIAGNKIYAVGAGTIGIQFIADCAAQITVNEIYSLGVCLSVGEDIQDCTITGNYMYSSTNRGISIVDDIIRSTIIGNYIQGHAGIAMYVGDDVYKNVISDNRFISDTSTGVYIGGDFYYNSMCGNYIEHDDDNSEFGIYIGGNVNANAQSYIGSTINDNVIMCLTIPATGGSNNIYVAGAVDNLVFNGNRLSIDNTAAGRICLNVVGNVNNSIFTSNRAVGINPNWYAFGGGAGNTIANNIQT
jgi:parallel beta-helix repeat protein